MHGVDEPMAAGDLVARGQTALAHAQWAEALSVLGAAAESRPEVDVLESLAWAAWWVGDADTLFRAREAVYREHLLADRKGQAARTAAWIATDHVDFRGDSAVCSGWLRRARRLLAGLDPCVEQGWLAVHEAEQLIYAGDVVQAARLGREAEEYGRRFGSVDLEMLGTATVGLAETYAGRRAGLDHLADAATAALADEFTELWSAGWSCCYVIYGCEAARDFDQAAQWCRQIERWATDHRVSPVARSCRTHHASVLMQRGDWRTAEQELTACAAELALVRPPWSLDARVRLAELRRRQGRWEEAAAAFADLADHPYAQLGMGELLLDTGDPDGACHRAEEYLRQVPPVAAAARLPGLDLLVRARLELGETTEARAALAELESAVAGFGGDAAQAMVAAARGALAAREGDSDRARILLEDAVRASRRASGPYQEAEAHLALARELARLGRTSDAQRHAHQARELWRGLGATAAVRRADATLATLDPTRSLLTPREREVLALVAEGLTNTEVAERLVLSPHTVNRHLTNILGRLGVRTRSAAVAEAVRRQLL